jgi:hypothetical protein
MLINKKPWFSQLDQNCQDLKILGLGPEKKLKALQERDLA